MIYTIIISFTQSYCKKISPFPWNLYLMAWFTTTVLLLYVVSGDFPDGTVIKNLPVMQEMQKTGVWSLGQEDPLE